LGGLSADLGATNLLYELQTRPKGIQP
jgi:hypothetical protein